MSLASAHLVLCRPAGDAKQRSLVSKPGADVAQPSEGDLTPLNHLQESIYICRSVSTQHREKEAPQNTTTSSAGAASRCAAAAAVGSRARSRRPGSVIRHRRETASLPRPPR
jgi:hypothetical protein